MKDAFLSLNARKASFMALAVHHATRSGALHAQGREVIAEL